MFKNSFYKTFVASFLAFAVLLTGAFEAVPAKANAATASESKASQIIAKGKQYLGVKYKFGAKVGNTSSFDCSSFTKYLYGLYGVYLPRTSKEQAKSGKYVSRSNLKPGDLVFFYSPIHHVAIYIGNGKILHTYGAPGVTISNLNSGWWDKHYTTARRVL
ncbi:MULTISPECIES: C40 family peptidase [Cohnella]|jgi:cell wall-associated NlpC family hydrolase|uniref:C40 family peptidase n=1 Tax=Cohnella TaxID=329857 RepID=UPI00037EB618|nr:MULTISPECIES: C40 family peptidase [Cohnella]REK68738.1 MAG: NlpC/P60 family protein [Cohnella sp.]